MKLKISKPVARKLFYSNHEITLMPVKCRIDSDSFTYTIKNNGTLNEFDSAINAFEYYNCNKDNGYYCKFFVDVPLPTTDFETYNDMTSRNHTLTEALSYMTTD